MRRLSSNDGGRGKRPGLAARWLERRLDRKIGGRTFPRAFAVLFGYQEYYPAGSTSQGREANSMETTASGSGGSMSRPFIFIGVFMIIGLVIFSLIVVIVAAVRANGGDYYRYPMCIRLISQKKYPVRKPAEFA